MCFKPCVSRPELFFARAPRLHCQMQKPVKAAKSCQAQAPKACQLKKQHRQSMASHIKFRTKNIRIYGAISFRWRAMQGKGRT